MYKKYFGLAETPFSIAPDPRYLYMSEGHREALAHLVYGMRGDSGFVLLTGEVGTGKTTICRRLLEQIPENSEIAFILNPKLTVKELLETICDELGIHYPQGSISIKVLVDAINAHLLGAHAAGRKTVLIIEEAQNLSPDVLEQVRLLTNLETNKTKLLQILMIGQPELRDILARPELRQIAQRITARYHLGPLSKKEVAAYVSHRLAVAGMRSQLFRADAVQRLYRISEGVPRLINVLCDRALLGAYVQGKAGVDVSTVERAAQEVMGKKRDIKQPLKRYGWGMGVLILLVFGVVLATDFYQQNRTATKQKLEAGIKVSASDVPGEISSMNTLQWFPNLPLSRSREMAYQALYDQWQVPYHFKGQGDEACRLAQMHGLRCLHRQGSLNSLKQLNRPAVLKLFDDRGREFYATLISLGGKTATFMVGPEKRKVDIDQIALRWFGDYTLLWKVPQQYRGDMKPREKSGAVPWLEKQLSLIQGRPARLLENMLFDERLTREVKQFQYAQGLVPDGIVGPETVILLDTMAGSGAPILTAAREE
jgi:general secretion pathway protein A